MGRAEDNKRDKLERILRAARHLLRVASTAISSSTNLWALYFVEQH